MLLATNQLQLLCEKGSGVLGCLTLNFFQLSFFAHFFNFPELFSMEYIHI